MYAAFPIPCTYMPNMGMLDIAMRLSTRVFISMKQTYRAVHHISWVGSDTFPRGAVLARYN